MLWDTCNNIVSVVSGDLKKFSNILTCPMPLYCVALVTLTRSYVEKLLTLAAQTVMESPLRCAQICSNNWILGRYFISYIDVFCNQM